MTTDKQENTKKYTSQPSESKIRFFLAAYLIPLVVFSIGMFPLIIWLAIIYLIYIITLNIVLYLFLTPIIIILSKLILIVSEVLISGAIIQLFNITYKEGTYEYSAVTTNLDLDPVKLWFFMAGHGVQEKTFAELKDGLAFDTVPTSHYGANSAWQVLSVLAFNLMKGFQVVTMAASRGASRKRRALYAFEMIQTMRYKWINRAGMMLRPDGYRTLDVGRNPEVMKSFKEIDRRLQSAA